MAQERDWDQYHTPKNLAAALSVEASELLEIFQWLSESQSQAIVNDVKKFQAVKEELADILYYVIRLADQLDIDLELAFWGKLKKSLAKYPVKSARGNSKKYTEF